MSRGDEQSGAAVGTDRGIHVFAEKKIVHVVLAYCRFLLHPKVGAGKKVYAEERDEEEAGYLENRGAQGKHCVVLQNTARESVRKLLNDHGST